MNDGGGWIWLHGLGPVWVPPWRPFGVSFGNGPGADPPAAQPGPPEPTASFARYRCSEEDCADLQNHITLLQEDLKVAAPGTKTMIIREIRQLLAEKRSCGCR